MRLNTVCLSFYMYLFFTCNKKGSDRDQLMTSVIYVIYYFVI